MSDAPAEDRVSLRRRMRALRQGLPPPQRVAAAFAVARRLAERRLLRPGSRVGVYLPMDGELDTAPVVDLARALGCVPYAPVITSFERRRMRFALLAPGCDAPPNRWGVREPASGPLLHGARLELVLVPCVAFDAAGGRLGMGAGFYDRHFSYLRWPFAWRRPRLLGLAFECQRVPRIDPEPWDVPLWGVVTEHALHGHAAGAAP